VGGWGFAVVLRAIADLAGFGDALGAVTLPLDAIVWGLATGITVVMLSALVPAIRASRISPMEAMRTASTNIRKPLKLRNAIGAFLTLLGAGLGLVGLGSFDLPDWLFDSTFTREWVWVTVGAVAIVIGATLLAAQLLVPIAWSMRGALSRIFRIEGKMAANNIHREPRRSGTTASALMIGVMLLALIATITESARELVKQELIGQTTADFFANTSGPPSALDDNVVSGIESVPGIDTVSRLGDVEAVVDGEERWVTTLDAATAGLGYGFPVDGDISDIGEGAFISPDMVEAGYEVGDTLEITGATGSVTVEVTGLYNRNGDGDVLIDWATAQMISDDLVVFQLFILIDEGLEPEDVREDLEAYMAENYPLMTIATPGEFVALVNQIVDIVLGTLSIMLSGALVIAVLGVTNTLLLSVTERTQEIGFIRAIGLSRSSVWAMVTVESVVMSVFGAVLGMVLGISIAAAVISTLDDFGFTTLAIPWGWMAAYTVFAIIAGIVAALLPAFRASRINILDAIASE